MNPLRVALLSPCYWPEVRRGSERFCHDLADGLVARGHLPRVITSHPRRPSRRVEDGVTVVRVWRPPSDRLERRMFESHLTHLPFSYASLRLARCDVAHAVYPTDGLVAARWGDRTGRPTVLSYMGIPHRRALANRRWRMEITRRAIGGASAVVVLSEAAAAAFRRWLGVDPRVISPGVDLGAFAPREARAPEPTVVCAAALDRPRKRVGLLVEAFAQVRRERPDARLVLNRPRSGAVMPDGPGIEVVDLDDRDALAAAYGSAWVSALPSTDEAFGLVLAEALACGTPCVGSALGGIPEVINAPGIGLTFSGEDPRTLARALLEAFDLAGDPRTAARCRARAEELSIDRTVERYVDLYAELLRA